MKEVSESLIPRVLMPEQKRVRNLSIRGSELFFVNCHRTVRKLMTNIFGDMEGILLIKYMQKRIDSEYEKLLQEKRYKEP